MATKILKTIVALRRGAESEYQSDYLPLKGEVAFVESSTGDLRMKVGDGTTLFPDLPYADKYVIDQVNSIVCQGYLIDGEFYVDTDKKVKIVPYSYKLYVELNTGVIYSYNGIQYIASSAVVPAASSTTAGIMKLYDESGINTDGTMTQKSITSEIGKKFIVSADEDETISFTNNN
jgi:hypothetical protein